MLVMHRLASIALIIVTLLGVPSSASAALQVTLAVSPSGPMAGSTMEILLRTYVPIGTWTELGFEPTEPWPFVPGLAYVLWPMPDLPFEVVAARADGHEQVDVAMTRDSVDTTLWRGTFIPTTAGTWVVVVAGFPDDDPGARVAFQVRSSVAGSVDASTDP